MESHLLQMRGLKPPPSPFPAPCCRSHLLQMRGLKQPTAYISRRRAGVASFTDAWIETLPVNFLNNILQCRIFYRCVD